VAGLLKGDPMKPNKTVFTILGFLAVNLLTLPSFAKEARPTALVRHVVAFRFAANVTAEQKQEVVDEFQAMKGQISSIVSLESGLNNSPEGLDKGFTHVFIVTFRTNEERDDYVYKDPVHEKFKALVGPLLDGGANGVIVLDFEASTRPQRRSIK
jgi:hypothetical protein